MDDDSRGRGERQARGLVFFVLIIEALWIFFHKYLPLDASLWALQSDAVREHLAGHGNDGLSMIPIPAANTFVPLMAGILSFLFSGEVVTRLLMVGVGVLLRGYAMLSLLRIMRVREELVYFLVPVFIWSGIFFVGSVPYLVAETLALALINHLLKQEHPRGGTYWFLSVGFALVAWSHALAFIVVLVLVLNVANEQRRSVHLSQGWLSNINSVASLIVPGCLVLLLRLFYLAPIFTLSTSGLIASGGTQHFLSILTISPLIREATFPASNIVIITVTILVILLVIASLVRAFLLPMEEVSWQSRSAKRTGVTLTILALLGFVLTPLGVETSSFLWLAAFMLIAGSYSRGPAVRRGPIDRLLRTISFIAMLASGIINGVSTNRGAEAASEVRENAIKLINGERNTARIDEHFDSISIHFVLDSAVIQQMSSSFIGSFSYAAATPLYLFGRGNVLSAPGQFQPEAGILQAEKKGINVMSPVLPINLSTPEQYFDPHLRVLAIMPINASFSSEFGPFAHSLTDTTGMLIDHGSATFRLVIGKLSAKQPTGLAELK